MLTCWRVTPTTPPLQPPRLSKRHGSSFCYRINALQSPVNGETNKTIEKRKKVLIVGSGWSGLGAAHHLSNQVLSFSPSLSLHHIQYIWMPDVTSRIVSGF